MLRWHKHFHKLNQSITISDQQPAQADFTYQP